MPLFLRPLPLLLAAALAGPAFLAAALLTAAPAPAEPLRLDDPRPRWVAVSVERSDGVPREGEPANFSPWLPGWLAPEAEGAAHVRVTVAGALVEEHLFEGQEIRQGSFSDYVLRLDAGTGHVVEASYAGVVSRRLRIGPLRLAREVELRASMSTLSSAGYEAPRNLLGEVVVSHCVEAGRDCTLVAPQPYDARTGRLHAVGVLEGRSGAIRAHLFSPFGQVRLREAGPEEEERPVFVAFP